MDMNRILIGKRIRQERLRSNLSLAQLAELMGTNSCKLSRIERGQEAANERQMEAIASACGCSVSVLLTPPDRMVTYMSLQKVRRGQYPGRPRKA